MLLLLLPQKTIISTAFFTLKTSRVSCCLDLMQFGRISANYSARVVCALSLQQSAFDREK
jgi:hypothetical protein